MVVFQLYTGNHVQAQLWRELLFHISYTYHLFDQERRRELSVQLLNSKFKMFPYKVHVGQIFTIFVSGCLSETGFFLNCLQIR